VASPALEGARRWGQVLLDIMARTTRVKGQRGEDEGVRASSPSWQYGRGRVSMMATVTRRPQASERVYAVEERVARLVAVIGRQGEDGSDGTRDALARPRACSPRSWHVLGVSGRASGGQCRASLELGRVLACLEESRRA
jgi:hypothetical protein